MNGGPSLSIVSRYTGTPTRAMETTIRRLCGPRHNEGRYLALHRSRDRYAGALLETLRKISPIPANNRYTRLRSVWEKHFNPPSEWRNH